MFRTVVVKTPGTFVGKRGERLMLRFPAKGRTEGSSEEEQIPLFRVGEILLPARGVSLSTDLIDEAVARGIPLTFLRAGGQPYAMLTSPMLTATVATRRAQLTAIDRIEGVELCRSFVCGKLRNQASLLVYFAKAEAAEPARKSDVLEAARTVREVRALAGKLHGEKPFQMRERLLGFEGIAAKAYWAGVKRLLEGRCRFEGREGRGAVDPVNALLNYGYGILTSRAWAAIMLAGLDPFAGMLHADRSGKPSLVLDLIEEFRAPVVDRAVLAHVRLGQPVRFEGTLLHESTRKAIADAVLERLDGRVTLGGRKLKLSSVLQKQARAIATHVRGEGRYRPFAMTW